MEVTTTSKKPKRLVSQWQGNLNSTKSLAGVWGICTHLSCSSGRGNIVEPNDIKMTEITYRGYGTHDIQRLFSTDGGRKRRKNKHYPRN